MTVSDVGDRRSYDADTGAGFDKQGYCLTQGDDGGETVKKATLADNFLGINFRSTLDETDDEVLTGGSGLGPQVAVEQDGVVNMLCKEGNVYNPGDDVYLSDRAGVAGLQKEYDTTGDGATDTTATQVGTVVRHIDLSGASSEDWVAVEITGHLGGE